MLEKLIFLCDFHVMGVCTSSPVGMNQDTERFEVAGAYQICLGVRVGLHFYSELNYNQFYKIMILDVI